jgi:hypothetical protein
MNLTIPLNNRFGMPSLAWLESNITIDEVKAIDFLINAGIVVAPQICEIYDGRLSLTKETSYSRIYRCTRKHCRKAFSLFSDTILEVILHVMIF